jgi:hypothetical protein
MVAKSLSNPFWKDVIVHYSILSNEDIHSLHEFFYLPLYTVIPVKEFKAFSSWYSKGLITDTEQLKTFDKVKREFGLDGTYLLYFRLIGYIPKIWRNKINYRNILDLQVAGLDDTTICGCIKKSINCKFIYKQLCQKTAKSLHDLSNKWENKINTTVSYEYVEKCFNSNNISTVANNLKIFQYRLLHRILATKAFLHKIGLSADDLCCFCNIHSETLEHLFFDCNKVRDLITYG